MKMYQNVAVHGFVQNVNFSTFRTLSGAGHYLSAGGGGGGWAILGGGVMKKFCPKWGGGGVKISFMNPWGGVTIMVSISFSDIRMLWLLLRCPQSDSFVAMHTVT